MRNARVTKRRLDATGRPDFRITEEPNKACLSSAHRSPSTFRSIMWIPTKEMRFALGFDLSSDIEPYERFEPGARDWKTGWNQPRSLWCRKRQASMLSGLYAVYDRKLLIWVSWEAS